MQNTQLNRNNFTPNAKHSVKEECPAVVISRYTCEAGKKNGWTYNCLFNGYHELNGYWN